MILKLWKKFETHHLMHQYIPSNCIRWGKKKVYAKENAYINVYYVNAAPLFYLVSGVSVVLGVQERLPPYHDESLVRDLVQMGSWASSFVLGTAWPDLCSGTGNHCHLNLQ